KSAEETTEVRRNGRERMREAREWPQTAELKAVRKRLVLRADRVRRHGFVDADRAGRGVRARRERPEVLERGGSDRGRERCRVRPLFIRVDEGRATGAPRRERPPVRRRREHGSPADRE